MELTLETPGLALPQKTIDYVEARFNLLKKFYPRAIKCDIVLNKEKDDRDQVFQVKARLLVPTLLMYAQEKAETIEIAVSKTTDDLKRQLWRYKGRFEILL